MGKSCILWALGLLLFSMPAHAAKPNSCIACHKSSVPPSLREYHAEWQGSVHAERGVTCDQCHGGDAQVNDKERSHRGVYPSMNPSSSVYYSRVPALCGSCHVKALGDFKTSSHYRNLMDKGVGPNCVTCHDAMSTKVLSPAEVEMFCTICHNSRSRSLPDVGSLAKGVLHRMAETERRLVQARATLRGAAQSGLATGQAEQLLASAAAELAGCKSNWHTFRLGAVRSRLEAVDRLVSEGLRALNQSYDDPK